MHVRIVKISLLLACATSANFLQAMNKTALRLQQKLAQQHKQREVKTSLEHQVCDIGGNLKVCALDLHVSANYFADLITDYHVYKQYFNRERMEFARVNVILCMHLLLAGILKKEQCSYEKLKNMYLLPLKDKKIQDLWSCTKTMQKDGDFSTENIGAQMYVAFDYMNLAAELLNQKGPQTLLDMLDTLQKIDRKKFFSDKDLPRVSSTHLAVASDQELDTLKHIEKHYGTDVLQKPLFGKQLYSIDFAVFYNAKETLKYLISHGCYTNERADVLFSIIGDPSIGEILMNTKDLNGGMVAKAFAATSGNLNLLDKILSLEIELKKKSMSDTEVIKLVRDKIKKLKKKNDIAKMGQYDPILKLLENASATQALEQKKDTEKMSNVSTNRIDNDQKLKKEDKPNKWSLSPLHVHYVVEGTKQLSRNQIKKQNTLLRQQEEEKKKKEELALKKIKKQEIRKAKKLLQTKAEKLEAAYSKVMQKQQLNYSFSAWKKFIAHEKEAEKQEEILQEKADEFAQKLNAKKVAKAVSLLMINAVENRMQRQAMNERKTLAEQTTTKESTKKVVVARQDPNAEFCNQQWEFGKKVHQKHGYKPGPDSYKWTMLHISQIQEQLAIMAAIPSYNLEQGLEIICPTCASNDILSVTYAMQPTQIVYGIQPQLIIHDVPLSPKQMVKANSAVSTTNSKL